MGRQARTRKNRLAIGDALNLLTFTMMGISLNVNKVPSHYVATCASKNGVPLEVVSKVILRHQDLKTSQVLIHLVHLIYKPQRFHKTKTEVDHDNARVNKTVKKSSLRDKNKPA